MKKLVLYLLLIFPVFGQTTKQVYMKTQEKINIVTEAGKMYLKITPKTFYGPCLSFYHPNGKLDHVCHYQILMYPKK